MEYQVLGAGYNFGKEDADVLYATNDKDEVIEAAKDFGQGTIVILVDEQGNRRVNSI